MQTIDINCDIGEGFGVYENENEQAIYPFISSANIACGFHAGDPSTMRKSVRLALEHNVAIGAHPGLPDLQGFGRREMQITLREAYDLVIYQVGALAGFVKAEGGTLQHVKPHGALYNMAAKNPGLAHVIAKAIYDFDRDLILFGLSGSHLVQAGEVIGLRTASEVFADRTYQQDGTLTPRTAENALITNIEHSINHVVRLATKGVVRSQQGVDVPITADTVCVHGDGPHALSLVQQLTKQLASVGVSVKSLGSTNNYNTKEH